MRLLHTSDWHLGRSFHGVGLLGAQEQLVEHLVDVVRAEQVDAVLISGDVYDRAIPGPETVALLDEALVRLLDEGTAVVVSSGNHDSATRLGFGSRVFERSGLHIRTTLATVGEPVELAGVSVYPLPFLEPALVAEALALPERTHAAVLRAAMQRVRADHAGRTGPAVVMAHAFVAGSTTSDSERDLSVGGMGAVPVDVFGGVDYAALGHLHGAQQVGDQVRYSGSPVALSFSETDQVKGSWLVDLPVSGSGSVSATFVEAPVPRPLARLRGTVAQLLADPSLTWAEQAWCQVTLTDAARPLGAMELVRARFPHTLQLLFDTPVDELQQRSYTQRTQGRADLDVCCDFLEHVRGDVATTGAERAEMARALRESAAARRRADDEGGLGDVRPARDDARPGQASVA